MIDLSPLKKARVLVLGNDGFIGRAVSALLQSLGATVFFSAPIGDTRRANLLDPSDVADLVFQSEPSHVLNLAGKNGGVGFRAGLDIVSVNTLIPLNLLRAVADFQRVNDWAPKVLMPVASCAYPSCEGDPDRWQYDLRDGVCLERDFLGDFLAPHPTVWAHGHAKRLTQLACRFAREQHGIQAVTVCPPTCFGPSDRYGDDRAKIMAAMVRRFADAADRGLPEVACWGDGSPLRQFLFVQDAASLILQALLAYDDPTQPLNVGHPQWEFSVKETAEMAAKAAGYRGEISWDPTRPNGQYRKCLNLDRQGAILGPQEFTPLTVALDLTVAAYRRDRDSGRLR